MIQFKNFKDLLKIEGMRQVKEGVYILDLDDTIRFHVNAVNEGIHICKVEWFIHDVEGWNKIDEILCMSVNDAVEKIVVAVARCNKGMDDANFSLKYKVKGRDRTKTLHPPVAWRGVKVIRQNK